MAHNLAFKQNGKAAMAYVGDTPWHGLGQPLTKGASIGVWKREAGMDWTAFEGTPMVGVPGMDAPDGKHHYVDFTDHKALFRSDTLAPLAIVGAGYKVVQPGEVLEFFRKLVEGGGWHIHTAGCLYGGRKVWALATRDEEEWLDSKRTDAVRHNILLSTSLDGSMRTLVADTSIRVVCWNTLSMALDESQAGGRLIKISHRQQFDADEVYASLGLRQDRFITFMDQARELASAPIKLDEARHYLNLAFRVANKPVVATNWLGKLSDAAMPEEPEINAPRGLERVLELFQGEGMGSALKTSKGTRWGLLNAVTQYVDHEMGRTDNSRLDSAWFGRGAELKTRAYSLLHIS